MWKYSFDATTHMSAITLNLGCELLQKDQKTHKPALHDWDGCYRDASSRVGIAPCSPEGCSGMPISNVHQLSYRKCFAIDQQDMVTYLCPCRKCSTNVDPFVLYTVYAHDHNCPHRSERDVDVPRFTYIKNAGNKHRNVKKSHLYRGRSRNSCIWSGRLFAPHAVIVCSTCLKVMMAIFSRAHACKSHHGMLNISISLPEVPHEKIMVMQPDADIARVPRWCFFVLQVQDENHTTWNT